MRQPNAACPATGPVLVGLVVVGSVQPGRHRDPVRCSAAA